MTSEQNEPGDGADRHLARAAQASVVAMKASLPVVIAVTSLIIGIAAVIITRDEVVDVVSARSPGGPLEVFLEPAQSIGAGAFIDQVEGLVEISPVDVSAEGPSGPVALKPGRSISGTEPAAYGGARQKPRCDRWRLLELLLSDATAASAWAQVQGIESAQIPQFVATLTPVVLIRDTRVTNYLLRDGTAVRRQSVLQRGTAVLIDLFGLPRVRCAGASPLNQPILQSEKPRYVGTEWPGLDHDGVRAIEPGATAAVGGSFLLQDIDGSPPFERASGTDGEADLDEGSGSSVADSLGVYVVRFDQDGVFPAGGCGGIGLPYEFRDIELTFLTDGILRFVNGTLTCSGKTRIGRGGGSWDADTGAFVVYASFGGESVTERGPVGYIFDGNIDIEALTIAVSGELYTLEWLAPAGPFGSRAGNQP